MSSTVPYTGLPTISDASLIPTRRPTVLYGDQAPLSASVVGLFKNIVGAGVLALPHGVSLYTDRPTGLVWAVAVNMLLGALSAYCFFLIGRLCHLTTSSTYAGMLARIYAPHWRQRVDGIIVIKTASAAVLYLIIIGNIAKSFAGFMRLSGIFAQRSMLLCFIAFFLLLPLCLQRSFKAIAPFAALGAFGTIYTAVVMWFRYAQGAYEPGGLFYDDAPNPPVFDRQLVPKPLAIFELVSMLSTAFIAHFNAPKFFAELADPTPRRFAILTGCAFSLAAIVMAAVMTFGFLTFGVASQGLILDNYADQDTPMVMAWGATLASVIFGFPFVLVAFRQGFVRLFLTPKDDQGETAGEKFPVLTAAMIGAFTIVASMVDDLGFVVAMIGAVLASTIIYILPTVAFLGFVGPRVCGGVAQPAERLEFMLCVVVLVIGISLGVLGAAVTIHHEAVKEGWFK